jgi:hypothetical protein
MSASRAVSSGPSSPAGEAPHADGQSLDLDGRTLLPGLWDSHVHMVQWAGLRRRLDVSGAGSATGGRGRHGPAGGHAATRGADDRPRLPRRAVAGRAPQGPARRPRPGPPRPADQHGSALRLAQLGRTRPGRTAATTPPDCCARTSACRPWPNSHRLGGVDGPVGTGGLRRRRRARDHRHRRLRVRRQHRGLDPPDERRLGAAPRGRLHLAPASGGGDRPRAPHRPDPGHPRRAAGGRAVQAAHRRLAQHPHRAVPRGVPGRGPRRARLPRAGASAPAGAGVPAAPRLLPRDRTRRSTRSGTAPTR